MKKEVKIPDIAENVESGLIANIMVSKGDKVEEDQSLVEIETDKATTDIPSPYKGKIAEIKVKQGDEVKVHQVILIIETDNDNEPESSENKDESNGKQKDDPSESKEENEERDKKPEKEEKDEKHETEDLKDIPASPSVRRLARELEVDLKQIQGTGPGERITADDVKTHSSKKDQNTEQQETQLPDFTQWGNVTREKMNNIRRITANTMTNAWQTIPQVTQFDEADITGIEEFRKNNQQKAEKQGGKLTITAILLKFTAFALQKFPRFNASIDFENKEIIYKHYLNIGVAVDTPQGLLVPVIRDVDKKSLFELATELNKIAQKARDKKLSPDEMQGGNFSISNLGGIGGTAFTPIVYPPQVAILGVARASYKQVYKNDEFKKRLVMPLSLTYDHRIIDGADGARFLRWVCDVIEDPYAILQ